MEKVRGDIKGEKKKGKTRKSGKKRIKNSKGNERD